MSCISACNCSNYGEKILILLLNLAKVQPKLSPNKDDIYGEKKEEALSVLCHCVVAVDLDPKNLTL